RSLAGSAADHQGDGSPAHPTQDPPCPFDVSRRRGDDDGADPRMTSEMTDRGDEDRRAAQGKKLLRRAPAETRADTAGRNDHGHVTHLAIPTRLRPASV